MYSFDVFDTLITRTVARPDGVFALMQDHLNTQANYKNISEYVKINFHAIRTNAEKLAFQCRSSETDEITLTDIYHAIALTDCLSNEEAALLMKLELKTELDVSIGITENIVKIKELVKNGEKVVCISDMYLNRETIQTMLIKADPIFQNIKLYVSSEYGKAKWSGGLYHLVGQLEQVAYTEWTHCGDDQSRDIDIPRALGIKTVQYSFAPFMECEKRLLASNGSDASAQLSAGASRNARNQYKLKGAAAIGASIGGNILYPYVQWILQESLKKNIKRLYFIARDGYVLKKMADIIIRHNLYKIETFYIYGSRKAWRLPSLSKTNSDLKRYLSWSYPGKMKNLAAMADILGVSKDDLISFLPRRYQDVDLLDAPLLYEISDELDNNNAFKEFLFSANQEKRTLVSEYLKQEIDVSDDDFAFVELSGSGYTQRCLADMIGEFYSGTIRTFFFKLDKMSTGDICTHFVFLPSYMPSGNLMIEMICTAPYGQTLGYKREAGNIIPILNETERNAFIHYGYEDYIDGILKFTEVRAETNSQIRLDSLILYMDYLTKSPDKELLKFFADIPNNETGRADIVIGYAPRPTNKQLMLRFLLKFPMKDIQYIGTDWDYSLLRCGRIQAAMISQYKKHANGIAANLLKKLYKTEQPNPFLFSIEELRKKKVLIYGAGKCGQKLYDYLKQNKVCKISGWIDQDYVRCQQQGLRVLDISDVHNIAFDKIVVAVYKKSLAEDMRNTLLAMHVPDEKIVMSCEKRIQTY